MRIQSEVGVGTVVNLYLPRAEVEQGPEALPNPPVDELPKGEETILLAEDDPLVRVNTAEQLTALGYRVTAVEDAARALEHAGLAPDLLFTDIVMPGDMTGFDLARKFREFAPQTKVLFMSGHPHHGAAAAEMRMNGAYMIGKPFTRNELALRVRQMLDEPCGRSPQTPPRQPEA
jgi:CheY-like chemotaxis protein